MTCHPAGLVPAPGAPLVSIGAPPTRPLSRLLAALRRMRQRWREDEEVARMTHRELRDMGVDRYDLDEQVARLRADPWSGR